MQAHAQEQDKQLHALGSYALTLTTYSALRAHGSSKLKSHLGAILLTSAVCLAKEYALDDHPDQRDLIADGAGVAGAVLIPFIFEF